MTNYLTIEVAFFEINVEPFRFDKNSLKMPNIIKFIIQMSIFLSVFNLNAQRKYYTIDKDTVKPKFELINISISEIDSQKIFGSVGSGFSKSSDSSYFRGNIKRAILELLHTEYAYLKIFGNLPNRYVQYHVYVNRNVLQRGAINRTRDINKIIQISETRLNTGQYEEIILSTLKQYYRFEIEEVEELTDVYVIYIADTEKFKSLQNISCDLEDDNLGPVRLEVAAKLKEEAMKKKRVVCYYGSKLNNQDFSLGYLLTNYTKEIVVVNEKDIDNEHNYHIRFEENEESSIQTLGKGLERNGLKLVKEKRMHKMYHVNFLD